MGCGNSTPKIGDGIIKVAPKKSIAEAPQVCERVKLPHNSNICSFPSPLWKTGMWLAIRLYDAS
jgi:hypothetical protein